MPRTLMDRRQNCAVNGEKDLNTEMENIARETDVSLDEMMSLACRQGKLDIVELLLESGAHVDYRNKAGNTPLLEACSQGHKDVAEYLLDHGANIDAATDTTSDSALTWACTLGNESIVALLLSRKSDVEHRTKDGCTALMFAALAGHVKVATKLLDCKANINVESDSNKDSPLTFASWKGHVDVVKLLLERNANIEHRTKEGFTPLMFSALGGHTDVAKELLKRQAKVNEPSGSNNDIPLTSACWKGHHEVVKLLLDYKSNIEHRTKDGCTPLMLAAREGHLIVAQLILDSGALLNVPSGSENNIPLTLACWKGHTDVVELLLNHNSDKEHRNKAGCTPLMLAAREGHLATTKLLLDLGSEVNTPSGSNDDTPLTLACWKGHHEVVQLLLDQNSYVDHQTKTGCTPLMEATREGHVNVVSLLLENTADVELPDNYGQSPLFMACWKGHRDVAELLLRYDANRESRTKTGITPLFQACRENHVSVVELLLDQGASVTASFPNSRENPMTLAAEKGYVELMDVLLSRGGNVDCRTKKGCSPFFLACKEGHLKIARSLYENSADIEVCDQRNISPLVAAFKNGHREVVEWILSIAKHVPSDEQCQKCITAPLEEKDNERDLLYLRTICYEMIKKAKKVKEQAALENAQSFLQELEEDKVREENKKKKQAAKRRDKRKKKKKQKEESEQQLDTTSSGEPQPSENRTDMDDDDVVYSEEEISRNVSTYDNRAQNKDWNYETEIKNHKNVNACRTMTVGLAQNEKGNTNSTEVRRDDQPQAMFDASDQQEHSSPKKREHRDKSHHEVEKNMKNKYQGKPISENRTQDVLSEAPSDVQGRVVISDETHVVRNEVTDEHFVPQIKNDVKPRDEVVSNNDFVSRGNVVKSSGHSDSVVKDGWKPTAQRAKQVSSDYLHSWKEVTRNSSSKTMVIQLTAPNALCGRVIGRGGTKINGITEESGAQITIGKPDPKNPNDRVITIKGSVKCVQKAKQLVSNALNSPSSLTQTQTPNLTSFLSSSHVQSQSTVAPIRGNYVAIPKSSNEWPTVVQAHSGPAKVQPPLNKTTDGKTVSVSDQSSENISSEARETRARSAPDLQCSATVQSDQTGYGVWSVDSKINNHSVSSARTSSPTTSVVPVSVYNPTTVSSATKGRTKSYAKTQDGSRLSYCEVATGMECVPSGNEDDVQKPKTSPTNTSSWNQITVGTEEADSVFADDENIAEINREQMGDTDMVNDENMTCNSWKEDVKEADNSLHSSPPSSANESPQTHQFVNIPPQSSSLFNHSSWSVPESKGFDKIRSVSWSGQDFDESDGHGTRSDFQSSQPDINTLPTHSIWSPVQPGGVTTDTDAVESSGWENSNSASSSRSSSRLELLGIMENDKNVSSFQQTTSPCDVKELSDEYTDSWISARGAHSAPSSPSLIRSRDQRTKFTRPVTAQPNSFDDMSDRLWVSRRTNDDRPDFDSTWNTNITQAQSSSSIYNEHVNNRNASPKLGSFKQYHDTSGVNKWSDAMLDHGVIRLLEQLSLTKYKQTFEENYITMEKLMNMTDTDLQKIGVPKGPRLKIIHAVQRNNGITNGPVSHKVVNERVPNNVPPPDVLGHVSGSGTLLNHMQMEQNVRVPRHTPFTPVLTSNTQVIQKQHTDGSLNPVLLPYLNNTHHSLLSLDPNLVGPPSHPHLEQHMNGLHPQQQFIMPSVPSDQYDPQSSYMPSGGVPYQQQMYYPRPPSGYYYYP